VGRRAGARVATKVRKQRFVVEVVLTTREPITKARVRELVMDQMAMLITNDESRFWDRVTVRKIDLD